MQAQSRINDIIRLTNDFVKIIDIKITETSIKNSLETHPDFPSLLSISDTLKKFSILNASSRIQVKSEIHKIPLPFISTFIDKEQEEDFIIVTDINNSIVKFRKRSKTEVVELRDFLKNWSGIFLIAEPQKSFGEPGYKKKVIVQTAKHISSLLIVFLSIYFYAHLLKSIDQVHILTNTSQVIHYIILLLGTFVSIFLLAEEEGVTSPLLRKICSSQRKLNCNAILNSKASRIANWLKWSDVGMYFFIGGALSALVTPGSPIPYFLFLFSLPYPFFSIVYQWRIARQWCAYCLIVQILLISGFLNTAMSLSLPINISINSIVSGLSPYVFAVLIARVIRDIIKNTILKDELNKQYLRLKYNPKIFKAILEKQKMITTPDNEIGIDIGNSEAKNILIKVCNPYCEPCSEVHARIEQLIEKNTQIKCKIIFTSSSDENDFRYKPVAHFLSLASTNEKLLVKNALDYWYNLKEKNYEDLAKTFPATDLRQQETKIKAMYEWCRSTEIRETPTLFLNGYMIPETFDINDLEHLLVE